MNVQPLRSESIVEPPSAKAEGAKPEVPANEVPRDSFAAEQRGKLMETLTRQPDVRPDVVDKGKALAEDPGYPPRDVIQNIARMFIKET